MSIAKATFTGRLVKDAELRKITTGKGGAALNFSIAVTKKTKSEEKASFHRLVWFFNKEESALKMAKYLTKGRPVFVDTEIGYTTEEGYNQQKKKATFKHYSFIVRDLEFLPTGKKENTKNNEPAEEGGFEGDDGFEGDTVPFEGDEDVDANF